MTAEGLEEVILERLAVGRASLANIRHSVKDSGGRFRRNCSFIQLLSALQRLERDHKVKWFEHENVWGKR